MSYFLFEYAQKIEKLISNKTKLVYFMVWGKNIKVTILQVTKNIAVIQNIIYRENIFHKFLVIFNWMMLPHPLSLALLSLMLSSRKYFTFSTSGWNVHAPGMCIAPWSWYKTQPMLRLKKELL